MYSISITSDVIACIWLFSSAIYTQSHVLLSKLTALTVVHSTMYSTLHIDLESSVGLLIPEQYCRASHCTGIDIPQNVHGR